MTASREAAATMLVSNAVAQLRSMFPEMTSDTLALVDLGAAVARLDAEALQRKWVSQEQAVRIAVVKAARKEIAAGQVFIAAEQMFRRGVSSAEYAMLDPQ